jgi:8-oxo-dGTP pyrophosphatase MutT (NUDIX family)
MKSNQHLLWKELSRKKILGTRVFDIYEVDKTSASGLRTEFVVLHSPNWVNVVPVMRDSVGRECFLMVHQFRQAAQVLTIEFPGGVLDPGETPEEGAARELLEETGYEAGKLSLAGKVMANPAIMDNWVYTYVAEDLKKNGSQNLDEHEEVDFELIPVEEVEAQMGSGPYCHVIMMAALDWYERWKSKK